MIKFFMKAELIFKSGCYSHCMTICLISFAMAAVSSVADGDDPFQYVDSMLENHFPDTFISLFSFTLKLLRKTSVSKCTVF